MALRNTKRAIAEFRSALQNKEHFKARKPILEWEQPFGTNAYNVSSKLTLKLQSPIPEQPLKVMSEALSAGGSLFAMDEGFACEAGFAHFHFQIFHDRVSQDTLDNLGQHALAKLLKLEAPPKERVQDLCPICKAQLSSSELIRTCPSHHGRLILPEQTAVFFRHLGVTQNELLSKSEGAKPAFPCPHCQTKMSHVILDESHIELCRGCGCLWLDVGELGFQL